MEIEPIETAKDWLEMAELAMEAGKYAQTAYSLEMAVEIALKAGPYCSSRGGAESARHKEGGQMFLAGNRSLPKSFLEELDGFLATFETLLRLRPIVGYGFEGWRGQIRQKEQAKGCCQNAQ